VNLALLDFLQPLTMFADLSNEWTIHRRILTAEFKTADFEARTDGYLRDLGSKEIRAIIEVKAASRARKAKPIIRPESAAMVNWIMNNPTMTGLPGRYESPSFSIDPSLINIDKMEAVFRWPKIGTRYI